MKIQLGYRIIVGAKVIILKKGKKYNYKIGPWVSSQQTVAYFLLIDFKINRTNGWQ